MTGPLNVVKTTGRFFCCSPRCPNLSRAGLSNTTMTYIRSGREKFEPPGVSGDESQEGVVASFLRDQRPRVSGTHPTSTGIPAAVNTGRRTTGLVLRTQDEPAAVYGANRQSVFVDVRRLTAAWPLWQEDKNLACRNWARKVQRPNVRSRKTAVKTSTTPTAADVRRVISALDDQGRWVSTFDGGLHVGQLNLPIGTKYLSSSVFSHNLKVLSKYVQQHK